ncbi:hypothetical protein [Rubrivirga sp.]|uniref:hypothetical protein n=1 Tax=Rubrivirga sp. TaxID=1885344 RepID=UPI003C75CC74
MLFRFALLLALGLSACDAVAPDTANVSPTEEGQDVEPDAPQAVPLALRVPVAGATAGDFLYSLSPLPEGGVFSATLETSEGGSASVLSTRTPSGTDVDFSLDGFVPDSVTVSYLADGVTAAAPLTYRGRDAGRARTSGGPDSYPAGSSDRDPDSYHWEERDGQIVLVKDYKDDSARRAGGPGTGFVTVTGERTRVTDVVFTVYGVPSGSSEAVAFESSSLMVLDWFDLNR